MRRRERCCISDAAADTAFLSRSLCPVSLSLVFLRLEWQVRSEKAPRTWPISGFVLCVRCRLGPPEASSVLFPFIECPLVRCCGGPFVIERASEMKRCLLLFFFFTLNWKCAMRSSGDGSDAAMWGGWPSGRSMQSLAAAGGPRDGERVSKAVLAVHQRALFTRSVKCGHIHSVCEYVSESVCLTDHLHCECASVSKCPPVTDD